jgi:transaldolase
MNALATLHDVGQSIWLDNITRALLTSGTLARFVDEDSVTGLTSNPTIFDKAISGSDDYDDAIRTSADQDAGQDAEATFFDLAIDDLRRAAALFRPRHDATDGVDGWVSLEVSPRLAHDTASTIAEAKALHARAAVPNLFIKVPGTPEGIPAIEELIVAGVPVNVTLLFSPDHYARAADAYQRGLERRRDAGLDLRVESVASVFISRWDKAVMGTLPDDLADQLGAAVAKQTYRAYRELLESKRWLALEDAGAHPQRLLWASTGTKDPALPDTFYIAALAAERTVNTMPEATLEAFADHGEVGPTLPADGGDADDTIARITAAGVDVDALAARLQQEGAQSFVESWNDLLTCVESKSARIAAG